jgi:hypothetical protein
VGSTTKFAISASGGASWEGDCRIETQFPRRETLGRGWGFLELANLGEKHCRTPTLDLLHPTLEILGRAGSHALWASKTPLACFWFDRI